MSSSQYSAPSSPMADNTLRNKTAGFRKHDPSLFNNYPNMGPLMVSESGLSDHRIVAGGPKIVW